MPRLGQEDAAACTSRQEQTTKQHIIHYTNLIFFRIVLSQSILKICKSMQRDAGHAGMPNARGSQRGTCQCSCRQWPQRMRSPSAAGAAPGRLRRLSQGASGDTPPPSPTAPALELVPVAAEPAAIAPARHTWAAAGCAVSGFVAARAGQPVSYLSTVSASQLTAVGPQPSFQMAR